MQVQGYSTNPKITHNVTQQLEGVDCKGGGTRLYQPLTIYPVNSTHYKIEKLTH